MPRQFPILLLLMLSGLLVSAARAQQPVIIQTLEVSVARADVVALGSVMSIREPQRSSDLFRDVLIQVEETVKGTPPSQVILPLLGWTAEEQSLRVGQSVMVFLVRTDRLGEFEALPPDIDAALQNYGLALLPGSNRILRLSSPALSAVTMDFRRLSDPQEVINAIADAAAVPTSRARGALKTVLIPAPQSVDVGAGLYGGAPVMLEMPVDERLERYAHDWAARRYDAQALTALRLFPPERNLDVLRRYLGDGGTRTQSSYRQGDAIYLFRAAAWSMIESAKSQSIPRPIIADPHDRYLPVGAWRAVLVLLGIVIITLGVCRRLFHGYSALRLATSASMVFAILIVGLWIRSAVVIDELLFESETAQTWFTSEAGALSISQIANLPHQAVPQFAFVETQQPGEPIVAQWDISPVRYEPRGLIRAAYEPSHTPRTWLVGNPTQVGATISTGAVSFGWLLLLCFVPGMVHALAALKDYATMRDRLLKRRCVNCGYDLRASPGRCPECGVEVVLR
jgi:hypothetical protein